MSESALVLSIVIPVYNEQGNLAPLAEALLATLRPLGLSFEILFVDDGSRDQTWQRISALSRAEPEIGGLRLSRNFGHQGALLAGLHAARGAAVISMDGDMQHPPEIVPRLIEAWQGGAKVVLTRRHDSQTTPFFKRITSSAFYWLYSRLADTPMEQGSSDFRLLDRQALRELLAFNYGEPFLRGAVHILGFPKQVIAFQCAARFQEKPKYTLRKMLALARNGLISHSAVPLKIGIWLGMLTGTASIVELGYVFSRYVMGQVVPGWTSLIGITTLLFSMLFVIVGILGFYIDDIHKLLKRRPHFIVADSVGPDRTFRG